MLASLILHHSRQVKCYKHAGHKAKADYSIQIIECCHVYLSSSTEKCEKAIEGKKEEEGEKIPQGP